MKVRKSIKAIKRLRGKIVAASRFYFLMAAPMASSSTQNFKHDYSKKPSSEDSVVDPVEEMLKKTGCIDLHYAVQECMAEHRDWRKCQEAVRNFQMCIERNAKKAGSQ